MGFFLVVFALASCSAILTALPPEDDADAGDGLEADGTNCGNGRVDDGEECDDGNDDDTDGCKQDCTFTCREDPDCRDDDACNGVETCNTDAHRCEAGQAQPDGFVCGYAPRYICLSGSCVQSSCGDGFIDTGAGESCDPPAEKCNGNCNLICLGDPDCPDDGNVCNGEEYCEMAAQECSHRNPALEGTECSADPRRICISGSCQESTCGDLFADEVEGEECDDGNLDDMDGCKRSCLYTCHNNGECDDELGCTDNLCITALHVCYYERSPGGTICRPVAGDCDVEEECDGVSDACPDDAFRDTTVLCRDAAGACDVQEYCSAVAANCPLDAKHDGSVICRGAEDVCDSPEVCDGSSNDCPADVFAGASTVCRPGNGSCDPAESCTGGSAACPPDVNNCQCTVAPDNCPSNGNICDGVEYCNPGTLKCDHREIPEDGRQCGTGPRKICLAGSCQISICGDGFADAGLSEECDDGNSIPGDGCETTCMYSCHVNDDCYDGHDCTQDICDTASTHRCQNPLIMGDVCRAIAGICDVSESCDGSDPDCPENRFSGSDVLCRPSIVGVCDPAENCTGTSPTCPADYWRCWLTVDGGGSHTCGIKTNNQLYCWGSNSAGQLGIGESGTTQVLLPRRVTFGTGMRWEQVSAGGMHTCAIANGGELYCWGGNTYGQLGDGTNANRYVPTRVGTDSDWVAVSAGATHTCGIRGSELYCWGNNGEGQIGIGSTGGTYVRPQEVDVGGSDVRLVACGGGHTCALTAARGISCWGRNASGQLGDGTTTPRNRPTPVSGITVGWTMVALGENHSCGLSTGGALYCWGENGNHQLGIGTTDDMLQPTLVNSFPIGPVELLVGVTAGSQHTCTRGSTALFCWGGNSFGQVGDGTFVEKPTPARVAGSDWSLTSAGANHTCSIKTNGDLYCWGGNYHGQVGDGTTTNRYVPVWIDSPPSYSL